MEKHNSYTTSELFKDIKRASALSEAIHSIEMNSVCPSVHGYLSELLKKHHIEKADVIRLSNLERSYGYQVFSGHRIPGRNGLLSIAIAMHLTLDETQRLLKIAQRGALYPKVKKDAAVIYCIYNQLDLEEAEALLERIGESLLR